MYQEAGSGLLPCFIPRFNRFIPLSVSRFPVHSACRQLSAFPVVPGFSCCADNALSSSSMALSTT